jgi:hypothetical protein
LAIEEERRLMLMEPTEIELERQSEKSTETEKRLK